MIILGIETATPSGGVALMDEHHLLGSVLRYGGRSHSQRIMAGLDSLLHDLGLTTAKLSGVAVSVGPGSFTGVRVGLAAAKALAYAAEIPLVGVSTLEAFAYRALGADCGGGVSDSPPLLCPILDARRGEVYWTLYDPSPGAGAAVARDMEPKATPSGSGLARLVPESSTRADTIARALAEALPPGKDVLLFGEGAIRAQGELTRVLGSRARFAPPPRMVPGPEEVAWLGWRRLRAGERDDPMTLMPVYLRAPDVQFPRRMAAPARHNDNSAK
jgi:tRNA threonylcarbamoyladenosine biosynthesis protein TsaB